MGLELEELIFGRLKNKMNKRGVIKISAGIFVLALLLILVFSSIFSSASEENSYIDSSKEVQIDLSIIQFLQF